MVQLSGQLRFTPVCAVGEVAFVYLSIIMKFLKKWRTSRLAVGSCVTVEAVLKNEKQKPIKFPFEANLAVYLLSV